MPFTSETAKKARAKSTGHRPSNAARELWVPHVPDAEAKVAALLSSDDQRIVLDAAKFIVERAHGKAVQPVSGPEGGPLQIEYVLAETVTHDGDCST